MCESWSWKRGVRALPAMLGDETFRDERAESVGINFAPRPYLVLLQVVFVFVLSAPVSLPHAGNIHWGLITMSALLVLMLLTIPRNYLTSSLVISLLIVSNLALFLGFHQNIQGSALWAMSCSILLIGTSSYGSSVLVVASLGALVIAAYSLSLFMTSSPSLDHLAALAAMLVLTIIQAGRVRIADKEFHHLVKTDELVRRQSRCDSLTGLPNRIQFMEHLQHSIDWKKRNPRFIFAVLFIDLDGFKPINDTLGHEAGDKVLRNVSKRLQASLRKGDVAARYGGDEFTLLINNIVNDEIDSVCVAERVLAMIKKPMDVGELVTVGASIGIAMSTNMSKGPDEFIRDADAAMYRAKALGKNCCVVSKRSPDDTFHEVNERARSLSVTG